MNEVLPDLDIDTVGLTVPATRMHVHSVHVTLERGATGSEVRRLLGDESRIALLRAGDGLDSCGAIQAFAGELDRRRGELRENCVWADSITTDGTDPYLIQAIDQRSDVVPENVDAVRAVADSTDAAASMARTDRHLGVGLPTGPVAFGGGEIDHERDDPDADGVNLGRPAARRELTSEERRKH